jgi:flagellar hook-associated protein 3 FlgL
MLVDAARVVPLFQQEESIGNINTDQNAVLALQTEATTGNQVNAPSDSPATIGEILAGQAFQARGQQYQQNITDGLAYSGIASGALNTASGLANEASSLLAQVDTAQLSGTSTTATALANQLEGVLNSLVNTANTQYNGQYVFAGNSADAAYDVNGNWNVTSNTNVPTRTVAEGQQVSTSVAGINAFGTTGANGNPPTVAPVGGSGLFGAIATAIWDLTNPTPGNLNNAATTQLAAAQAGEQTLLSAAAQVGTAYQTFEAAQTQNQNTVTASQGQVATLLNANLAQVTTELSSAQNTYESALWATGQVMNSPSLSQFLA